MPLNKKQREYLRNYMSKRRRKLGIPSRKEIIEKNRLNFLLISKKVHKNKYDYSQVVFIRSNVSVEIICSLHGKFFQRPTAHVHQKQGCPTCGMEKRKLQKTTRKTTKEFIQKALRIHNALYDYSNTNYINVKTKVDILCPQHGTFQQEAKAHLRGQGCPTCANLKRASFYESKGERQIQFYLESNGFVYEKQKTFSDCKYKMLLRYDFFVPIINTLIEFDGEQHYKFFPRFHVNKKAFELMQRRDKIKTEYAIYKNISLIRIKWNDDIDQILNITLRSQI